MDDPKVLIIIPNWNGLEFLPDCLESLFKINYQNFLVCLVDNGSTDDSISFVAKNFPQVYILKNKENLGFAAACNQGIKYGLDREDDYILLLNNDTVVTADFLEKMVAAAKDDKTGIVGAKIYYFDQPEKIWFAGGKFIKWRASGQHVSWQKLDLPAWQGNRNTDFITGCVMLIKKQVFKNIGMFYEPYFLSVEDLDFCWRAKKNGWKIKVVLDARVWHKVSSSRFGEFSFSNGYYGTRNRLGFAFKRTKNYLGGLVLLFLVVPIRLIQWFIDGKPEMAQGMILGVRDFFSGKSGKYK